MGQGDEVDVGVGHFEADHCDTYLATGHGGLDGARHFVGEALQAEIFVGVEVEDIVDFVFWNDQRVTRLHGVDVEECEAVVVFGYLV